MKKLMLATTVLVMLSPAVMADHRSERPIVALANQMERAAEQLHNRAERLAYRGHHARRFNEETLRALHRLERQANRFQREVRYNGGDRRELRQDFRQLQRAFFRAADSMDRPRLRLRLRNEWERVEFTMNRLERVVDGSRYARAKPRRGRDFDRPRFSISVDTARGSRPRVSINYRN